MTPLFFSLFSLIFLALFSFSLTLFSGTYIVSDLGGSTQIAIYAFAFFGIGNAIGVPLGKQLLNFMDPKHILTRCLFLFALFACLGATASNYPSFLVTRFLEGCVSGPFYVVVPYLFSKLAPLGKKQIFESISFAIYSLAPILGVCLGGWIAYDYSWRYLFHLDAGISFALLLSIAHYLKNDKPQQQLTSGLNSTGLACYTLGITTLGIVLITGQEFDWFRSHILILLTVIGVLSITFVFFWDWTHPHPVIDLRLLKQPSFAFATLNLVFLFATYFGIVTMLSLWLTLYVNYTPIWLSFLLGTMILAGLIAVVFTKKIFKDKDPRWPLGCAILFFGISCFYTTLFNHEVNLSRVMIARIFAGFGLTLFIPPIRKLYAQSVAEIDTLSAEVFFHIGRALSSSIGVALYQILWQRREVFYHERLGEKLTLLSMRTQAFIADAASLFALRGKQIDAELDIFLEKQAFSLALDDCFYLMGWFMVGLLSILILTTIPKQLQKLAKGRD